MKKNKSIRDAYPNEEAARKLWEGNEEFSAFAKKHQEDTYKSLVGTEGHDNDFEKVLVPGIATLVRYYNSDKEYAGVLMLFIDALIRSAKKLQNARQKRNELWKIIFTLNLMNELEGIGKTENFYDFLVTRVSYTLNMYLWHDFAKQKEAQEESETEEQ